MPQVQSVSKQTSGLLAAFLFSPFRQVRVIYRLIWNSLRCKITALLETRIAYRFNKPRKPGWTRRRCRPVRKVTVRMVQSGTSAAVSRQHVRRYRYVLYVCALYTLPSKRGSRDPFVTARAIADLSRVRTRSRWISLAIRQIDRIHFAEGVTRGSSRARWLHPDISHLASAWNFTRERRRRTPAQIVNHPAEEIEVVPKT